MERLTKRPKNSQIWIYLCLAYLLLGGNQNHKNAIDALNKALECDLPVSLAKSELKKMEKIYGGQSIGKYTQSIIKELEDYIGSKDVSES